MVFALSAVTLVLLLLAAVFVIIKNREKSALCDKDSFGIVDCIGITVLVIISVVMIFTSLGNKDAPKTSTDVAESDVVFKFNEPVYVDTLMIYPVSNEYNELSKLYVAYTDENGTEFRKVISVNDLYSWFPFEVSGKISFLMFHSDSKNLEIGEIGFLTPNGVLTVDDSLGMLYVQAGDHLEPAEFPFAVFDEPRLVPELANYMNGMYFDEELHARTAKEYIDNEPAYEWTHPPLGKILISAGIRMFGMNPFGWRFMSGVFGVLTVAVLYVFAKLVMKNSLFAFASGLLMSFDFMHHVQSRIGTVDVFLVFFIMLMYMFLYMALAKERVRYLPLLLSGISFGLAFSVKWSAAYAVLGVGILLLLRIFKNQEAKGERIKLVYFSAMVFALIPICIYILFYIPFVSADGKTGFEAIVENQMKILSYHGGETVRQAHDFSSKWYTWALDIKPVMYYSAWNDADTVSVIYVFGNPIIWWLGVIGVGANVFLAAVKKDKRAVFLLTGYFSCLLPWMFIARDTFIYHYYPCTVFMILMIANLLRHIYERKPKLCYALCAVTVIASVSVFVMFLPAIRGVSANTAYIDGFLRWLPSWKLYI